MTNPAVVQLAQNGGFDALFIDLEHSTLSINDASQHCTAALQLGITPFVRVPYQCGNGFVQRVMDGGAMGVVFPHIHNKGMLIRCISLPVADRDALDQTMLVQPSQYQNILRKASAL